MAPTKKTRGGQRRKKMRPSTFLQELGLRRAQLVHTLPHRYDMLANCIPHSLLISTTPYLRMYVPTYIPTVQASQSQVQQTWD